MHGLRTYTAASLLLLAFTIHAQIAGRDLPGSNASTQIRMEAEGTSAADPVARLQQQVQQWSQTLGPVTSKSQPQIKRGTANTAAAWSVQFANDRQRIHAFVTTDKAAAVCHVSTQTGLKMMFTITGALQRCSNELQAVARTAPAPFRNDATNDTAAINAPPARTPAGRPTAAARPGAPPKPVSADQPPAHPENWNSVADVLFRSSYTVGYGGMMIMQYEPLVLFRDGTYFEAYDAALEDLDLAQERQLRPVHFGTWRAQGMTYVLTDNKGRPHDYKLQDGNLFKAFSAEQGGPLNMTYKSVSGGGNSAMGGDVGILIANKMAFTADGRFSNGSDVGILGSGNTSGVSMAGGARRRSGVGSYKVQKHTIELRYPDGRSERRFFAYSSYHTPAQVDRDMVFLGDTPYARDK